MNTQENNISVFKTVRNWLFSSVLISIVSVSSSVYANPVGGNVTHGQVTFSNPDNQTLIINQASDKAIINWQDFSILENETTQFVQPDASSMALNRVTGGNVSQIYGNLVANGKIILINPQGIHFGANAHVDVASIMASSLNLSDNNFLNNQFIFQQVPGTHGAVVNHGLITAQDSGLVALIGPGVENHGILQARLGTVALGAGHEMVLDFYGDQLINFAVTSKADQAAVDVVGVELTDAIRNTGNLIADGGQVLVSAAAAQGVVDNVINMSGYAQANSVSQQSGRITLNGGEEGWVYLNNADLVARGEGADEVGGTVKVLGERIALLESVELDVSGTTGGGEILVGGNFQGQGPEQNAYQTYVGGDAALKADAIENGDGGRVIVWADDSTLFYGDISAQGGAQSGNGGFAEVSGKKQLGYHGYTNLMAAMGETGSLLLDPDNIVIDISSVSDGSDNGSNANVLDPTDISFANDASTDWIIYGSEIEASSASSDITIRANGFIDFDGSGTLTVDNDFTLIADQYIDTDNVGLVVNGDLYLESLNSNVRIESDIAVTGEVQILAANNIVHTGGDDVTTSGGDVTYTAGNNVELDGNISSDGGDITFNMGNDYIHTTAATVDADGGDIYILADGVINVENGDIRTDLTGSDNTLVELYAKDVVFTGSPGTNVIRGDIVRLIPHDGDTVDIGGNGSADFTITDAELDFIDSGQRVRIGSDTSGDVVFTAPIGMLNSDRLRVRSGGSINDTGGGAFFIDDHILLVAEQGIGTTSPLGIDVENLSASTDTGGINIRNFSTSLDLTSNAGLSSLLVTSSGGITLQSDGDINVFANIESPGDIDIRVDDTAAADGEDFRQQGGSIESHNGSVRIRAGDDIRLDSGDLVRANDDITLVGDFNDADAAGSDIRIGFGNVISDANTINITTGNDNDSLEINDINNITGDINFNAGASGSDNDVLSITNGTVTTTAHNFTNQYNGSIDYDGTTIDYTNLDSITDLATALTRSFSFASTADVITVDNVAAASQMVIFSTGTSVPVTFENPTNLLSVSGGVGNDTIMLQAVDPAFTANVSLEGNADNDSFSVVPANVGGGSVTVNGNSGSDTLLGQNTANTWNITANNAGNVNGFVQFSSVENLTGGTNNDAFVFTDGVSVNGTLNGLGGTDTINYAAYNTAVIVDLSSNSATGSGGVLNVENVVGGQANDDLTGNSVANLINGGLGDDVINGEGGNDILNGDGGADVINGGNGADTLNGGADNDTLNGNAGNDILNGNGGNDIAVYSTGTDVFNGNGGNDTFFGPDAVNTWNLTGTNTGTLNATTFDTTENLEGGIDTDTFVFADGASVTGYLEGSAGIDLLDYTAYTTSVTVDLASNSATGTNGVFNFENITGGQVNDSLTGNNVANVIAGGLGDDVINGEGGNDILNGDGGADVINGGNGADTLNGGTDNDTLNGNAGDDILNGNGGNDIAIYSTGTDVFNGNGGNDTFFGPDAVNTWNLTGTNTGTLNATTFDTTENLEGGIDTDTFIFADGASVTGYLEGSAGIDLLDYTAYTTSVTVDLASNSATGTNGVFNFENITGGQVNDSLTGNNVANVIAGGLGDDVINGEGGNDILNGDGGADVINGGNGADTLNGGTDNDTLNGNAGNDILNGNGGNDIAIYSTGTDVFNGNGGNDTFFGPDAVNTWNLTGTNTGTLNATTFDTTENLEGGIDADTFIFADGASVTGYLEGSDGIDLLDYTAYTTSVTVDLASNSATGTNGVFNFENITGSQVNDSLTGNNVVNVIHGNGGDDILNGNEDNDVIEGGDGNDVINGNAGDDILTGGLDNDTINGGAGDDLIDGSIGNDILNGEGGEDTIVGGEGSDTISGGSENDSIDGGQGTDVIHGDAGDDALDGGADDDQVFGGSGHDIINGGDGHDHLEGNNGDDTIYGNAGNDTLLGQAGDDKLDGGLGDDIMDGGTGNDIICDLEGGNDTVDGGAGDDTILTGDGDDTINGDEGDDTIDSGAGDDTVNGNGGDDTIHGDVGNDTIHGGAGDDILNGGAGDDTINGNDGNDILNGDEGDDKLDGGLGDDVIDGGEGNDIICDLEGGDDTVDGGSGDDTISTGDGDDTINGDDGDDTIDGGAGDDTINGNDGNDTLNGDEGDDILDGDEGDDKLDGGAGDDVIDGGEGTDTACDVQLGDDVTDVEEGNYLFTEEEAIMLNQVTGLGNAIHDIYDGSLSHRFSNNSNHKAQSGLRIPEEVMGIFLHSPDGMFHL